MGHRERAADRAGALRILGALAKCAELERMLGVLRSVAERDGWQKEQQKCVRLARDVLGPSAPAHLSTIADCVVSLGANLDAARAERDAALVAITNIREEVRGLLGEVASAQSERDAAVREKNVTHEFLYAAQVRVKGAEQERDELERMLGVLRSDLEAVNAALAAAKGKLVALLASGKAISDYAVYGETQGILDTAFVPLLHNLREDIAAAEQGGA